MPGLGVGDQRGHAARAPARSEGQNAYTPILSQIIKLKPRNMDPQYHTHNEGATVELAFRETARGGFERPYSEN